MQNYQTVIEINALHLQIGKHHAQIITQELRQQHLANQITEVQKQQTTLAINITNTMQEVLQQEQLLASYEQRWENAQKHSRHISCQTQLLASQKEIAALQADLNTHQDQLLKLWEAQEGQQRQAAQYAEFLAGSRQTQIEIDSEIQDLIQLEHTQIARLNQRIIALASTLGHQSQQMQLEKLRQQFPKTSFLCHVQNDSCSNCRSQISKHWQQQLAKNLGWELCTNCQKLLIPEFS